MRAMILAAGRGERMRPFSDHAPKPLLEAGGHRLIEYHLASFASLGVRDVVVNLSWLGQQIKSALGDGSHRSLTISYSDEGPIPLGTGGGLYRALSMLGTDPFLLVNGDIWIDLAFETLRGSAGSLAHLVLVENPEHHPGGDFGLAPDGRVIAAPTTMTYAGVALIDPRLFKGCGPGVYPLRPLLDRALAGGGLTGQRHGGVWSDVGTPERLQSLDALLRTGRARHPVLSSPLG